MIHKRCGGEIIRTMDGYSCKKCKRVYKCVGYEEYLRDVVENYNEPKSIFTK